MNCESCKYFSVKVNFQGGLVFRETKCELNRIEKDFNLSCAVYENKFSKGKIIYFLLKLFMIK